MSRKRTKRQIEIEYRNNMIPTTSLRNPRTYNEKLLNSRIGFISLSLPKRLFFIIIEMISLFRLLRINAFLSCSQICGECLFNVLLLCVPYNIARHFVWERVDEFVRRSNEGVNEIRDEFFAAFSVLQIWLYKIQVVGEKLLRSILVGD